MADGNRSWPGPSLGSHRWLLVGITSGCAAAVHIDAKARPSAPTTVRLLQGGKETSVRAVAVSTESGEHHSGQLGWDARTEVDAFNVVRGASRPVLMLSGEHDMIHSLETSARPLFKLWNAPEDRNDTWSRAVVRMT